MRITGLLFAFYILLLAAVPCCMIDNCPDDKTEQAAGHEQGDDDCGSCSPFFSCEGCAAATIAYEPFHLELISLESKSVFTAYMQPYLPQAAYDFWQPPKLV